MVWATKRIKYCAIALVVLNILGCLSGGIAYITATTLMPYHLEYVGMSTADIQNFSPKLHNLIVVLIKLVGAVATIFLSSAIVIFLIPFRRGERWAWITTFVLGLLYLISVLAATFYVGAWIKWIMVAFTVLYLVFILIPFKDFFVKR